MSDGNHDRELFHDKAERFLRFVEHPPGLMRLGEHRVSYAHYNGAIALGLGKGETLLFPDVSPVDLKQIGVPLASFRNLSHGVKTDFSRLRRVRPSQVRGRIHQKFAGYPHLFEFACSVFDGGGKTVSYRNVFAWTPVGHTEFRWADRDIRMKGRYLSAGASTYRGGGMGAPRDLGCGDVGEVLSEPEMLGSITAQLGLEFSMDYEWRVSLRLTGGDFALRVLASLGSIRDLFKLRDIEAGMKRRAALRHWVSEHRRASTSEDAIWVRRHLRGREVFSWDGISGTIEPAPFDVRDVERSRRDAEIAGAP